MPIPLEKEILDILSDKGITLLDGNQPVLELLDESVSTFRSHLVTSEPSHRPAFSQNSFWDITPKYRFDILKLDVVRVTNALVGAIGLSYIYLGHLYNPQNN